MNAQSQSQTVSLSSVFQAFRYWPRVLTLLWRTHPRYLLVMVALTALQGVLPVISLLATQHLVNSVVRGWSEGFGVVLWGLAFVVASDLFYHVLMLAKNHYEKLFESLVSYQIQSMIMEKSVSLAVADFEDPQVQDQLKRAQSEAGHRPFQVMRQMLTVLGGIVTLCSAATVLFVWKWWAALLLIVLPFLAFYSMLRLGQREFEMQWHRTSLSRKSWYYGYLLTRDDSFKEVKMFALGGHLLEKFRGIYEAFYREDKGLLAKRTRVTAIFQGVDVVIASAMFFLVLRSAYLREIQIGNVVGLVQAMRLTVSTSQNLMQGVVALCHNNLYLEQLFLFLDRKSSEAQSAEGSKLQAVPPFETIEFRNVRFQYPGAAKPTLEGVSFTVRRGESLAIVGHNGSGKSTMVKLLLQLYETFEGEILINGVPIGQYDRNALRRRMGVVFQDFVRYEMTLRENIGFGDLELLEQDDRLAAAAEQAGIERLVQRLPQGLESQLGRLFDEGSQLSGGQWQRVAIARAFLRQADLYVLDEPSAFLDPEAEHEVFQTFRRLVDERIGLFISHRYSSVRFADQILVMDEGRVKERGTHQELMGLDGLYARLYRLQMSEADEVAFTTA